MTAPNTVSPATARAAFRGQNGQRHLGQRHLRRDQPRPTGDGRFEADHLLAGPALLGPAPATPATCGVRRDERWQAERRRDLIRQCLTDGWYPTGAPVPGNRFGASAALVRPQPSTRPIRHH
jgi:hypothetical protein